MSDTVYQDLLAAGAPALPEGYFYRVRYRPGSLSNHVNVQVRRHRRFGSTCLAGETSRANVALDAADVLPRIAEKCRAVWESIAETEAGNAKWAAFEAALRALEGDHP